MNVFRDAALIAEVVLIFVNADVWKESLTHCGRVTQICVFNTVKLGTSASSP